MAIFLVCGSDDNLLFKDVPKNVTDIKSPWKIVEAESKSKLLADWLDRGAVAIEPPQFKR